MTERELRRLSRADLLELLLAQRRENEQLADRTIKIDKAGSLAEASLQLSGIFNAAEDSCRYYMDNIRLLSERQSQVCQQMERETKEKCERMVAEAERKTQQCWDNCAEKIKQLVDSFEGLQQVMDLYSTINSKRKEPTGQVYGNIY